MLDGVLALTGVYSNPLYQTSDFHVMGCTIGTYKVYFMDEKHCTQKYQLIGLLISNGAYGGDIKEATPSWTIPDRLSGHINFITETPSLYELASQKVHHALPLEA